MQQKRKRTHGHGQQDGDCEGDGGGWRRKRVKGGNGKPPFPQMVMEKIQYNNKLYLKKPFDFN